MLGKLVVDGGKGAETEEVAVMGWMDGWMDGWM